MFVQMPGQELNLIVNLNRRTHLTQLYYSYFTIHRYTLYIYMLLQQGCGRINACSGNLKHNGTG